MKHKVIFCLTSGLCLTPMTQAATTSYRTTVLADSPIVYYEFDETSGNTAANSATTGASYTGTFNTAGGSVTVGQASFAQGGTAYDFGGGFVGAASAVTSSLDEWTVEAWVNYDAAKTSASNFLSNDQGGWNDDVLIGIGAEANNIPAGTVGLVHQGNPGSVRETVSQAIDAGQWYHVVMTGSESAGEFRLYLNGVQVAINNSLANGATFNGAGGFGGAPHLTVGAARPNSGDAGYRPYDGFLDEVAVYDSVLDADTIGNHFNVGSSTAGTPPVVVSLNPADGSDEVAISSNLEATFNESLVLTDQGTVILRNLTLGAGSDIIISLPDPQVSVSGSTLTINPSAAFALDTDYAVRISDDALEDVAGDAFVGILNDTDWNFTVPSPRTEFGLTVSTYAPEEGGLQLKWPTHIAFGPGTGEVITDLKNNRFVYRDSPDAAWQASPVSVSGQHSLVFNPKDGLYYANDTGNNRVIAFSDLSSGTIAAQTRTIAGVSLDRPHDILRDPATGWIYALNPNSGYVFRFTVIGENESAVQAPTGGYARAISLVNGKIYVIGSAKGRIVEIVDWDTPTFKIYDSHDPSGGSGPAGSWTRTGLVINDADYFDGHWYATSYFTSSYAGGTDFNENKFIRFKTLDDLVSGNWTDLNSLVPSGMTPYFLTSHGGSLCLAIFNHESPGNGDAILRFNSVPNDFNSWISDPSFGLDPAERGFGFDPDGDDLDNGIEAWLGTHPGEFNAGFEDLVFDGTTATFEHPQNDDPPSDLTGSYEWSPNLDDWYASGSGPAGGPTVSFVPNTEGKTTTVTATASEVIVKLFLRVRVMQLP